VRRPGWPSTRRPGSPGWLTTPPCPSRSGHRPGQRPGCCAHPRCPGPGRLPPRARPGRARRGRLPAQALATGAASGDRQPRGPPLPLPRLRARRQLVEVRTADLDFSVEEAAALLGAGTGLRLEREQVAALVESLTEWELEVLRLLAARRSNAGIVAELVVEQSTSRHTSSMCTASWASTAAPRRWPAPARCGCSTDPRPQVSPLLSTLGWTRPARHAAKLTTRRSPDKEITNDGRGMGTRSV
jgi:hypothetical protein